MHTLACRKGALFRPYSLQQQHKQHHQSLLNHAVSAAIKQHLQTDIYGGFAVVLAFVERSACHLVCALASHQLGPGPCL